MISKIGTTESITTKGRPSNRQRRRVLLWCAVLPISVSLSAWLYYWRQYPFLLSKLQLPSPFQNELIMIPTRQQYFQRQQEQSNVQPMTLLEGNVTFSSSDSSTSNSNSSDVVSIDGNSKDTLTLASSSTLLDERSLSNAQQHDGTYTGNGAFVHVGKTAGSTISLLLRHGCHSWMPHPCRQVENESMASKLVQKYYHVPDFGLLPESKHDFYIISLRDPLERTISSFVFEHLQNRLARQEVIKSYELPRLKNAYKCFPTLEKFVAYLQGDSYKFSYPYRQRDVNAASCRDLACAALHGKIRPFNHFFFNYVRIKASIPTTVTVDSTSNSKRSVDIYVTRQEYLWDDWKTVNLALGQTWPVYIPVNPKLEQRRNHSTTTYPVPRELSQKGRDILCTALQKEYKAYLWLLRNAKNLNHDDVQKSIATINKNCPQVIVD